MILENIPALLGLQGASVFERTEIATAIATADLTQEANRYALAAIANGLPPAAQDVFKQDIPKALFELDGEAARKRLAEIVGNTSQRQWSHAARFAVSPEAPTVIAETFLADMEKLGNSVLDAVIQLNEGDIRGLEKIHTDYMRTLKNLGRLREPISSRSGERAWVEILFSSASQYGASLAATLEIEIDKLIHGKITWDVAMGKILYFHNQNIKTVLGKQGYRVSHVKRELAEKLMNWLESNFPVRHWEDGKLKLVNTTGLVWEGFPYLHSKKWPPDPERDPVLQKYLNVLGWRLTVQTEENQTVALLDFGKDRHIAAPDNGPPRNAKGGFELEALTPNLVEGLSQGDKVMLTKQLMRALFNICAIYDIRIKELKEGDWEGLERLGKALHAEWNRLGTLFPKDELSNGLIYWLFERPHEKSWEAGALVLRYTDTEIAAKSRISALTDSPWPPNPENDIVLKTYLEVLGWRMVVEGSGPSLLVRLVLNPSTPLPTPSLKQRLDTAWANFQNPNLGIDFDAMGQIIKLWGEQLLRLCAVLDCLIDEKLKEGKILSDIVVAVEAHGPIDPFAIQYLIQKGVKVVSRETTRYQSSIMDTEEANGADDMRQAKERGQFILSPITSPHPGKAYDIVIWAHPTPSEFPSGLGNPHQPNRIGLSPDTTPDTLIENMAANGYLLIQTEEPGQFIRPFLVSGSGFRMVWHQEGLHDDNYLLPSTHITHGDSEVALFKRISMHDCQPAAQLMLERKKVLEAMQSAYEKEDFLTMGRIAMRMFNEFRFSLAMQVMERRDLDSLAETAKAFNEGVGKFFYRLKNEVINLKSLSPEIKILLTEGVDKQLWSLNLFAIKTFKNPKGDLKPTWAREVQNYLIELPSSSYFQNMFRDPAAADIEEKRALLRTLFEPICLNERTKTGKAMGDLALLAAKENGTASALLKELAEGKSVAAPEAKWLMANMEQFKPMVHAKDRRTLAHLAKKIADEESRDILDGLLSNRIPVNEQLAWRLEVFAQGFDDILIAIDSPRQKEAGWVGDNQASRIFHMDIGSVIMTFRSLARRIRQEKTFPITPLTEIHAIDPAGKRIANIVYAAVLKNALGILSKGIQIEMDMGKDISSISPRTGKIVTEALGELILNAIKYADGTKKQWIHIRWNETSKTFTVEDNGMGIQPENLGSIWEPGYRENRTVSSGSGRGLFFIKESIEAMGGSISVTSTVDVGTKFIITLGSLL